MGPTVAEIKESLDNLGVSYKATMRKGELAALLEQHQPAEQDDHYSPPYTRRRTTMSAADIALSQPLNPAGALLEKFDEEPESLEDEVDVKIFRESSPIKESVIEEQVAEIVKENGVDHSEENGVEENGVEENGVGESEDEVDGVTESEVTGSSEAEDALVSESIITSVLENSPDGKVVTRSTTKRRSTRMSVRHKACNAALFSDEETVEPEEMTIEEKKITDNRGQSLRKILIISIFLVLLANLVAYLHINNPGLIAGHCNTVKSWFVEAPSSEELPAK